MELKDKEIEELQKYISLEGTEYGETADALLRLCDYEPYLPKPLYNACVKEVRSILKDFKENFKIVETEETYTRKTTTLEPV